MISPVHCRTLSVLYIILAILSCFVLWCLLRAFASPLRNVPGPFFARFTRLWKLREYYKGGFEKKNIELHHRYGAVVRVAPNEYSIDDPQAVKVIYGHGSQFQKSSWYYASGHPDVQQYDLFAERDSKRHAVNRRKVAAAYSMSALLQMEPFVDECTSLLHGKFRQFSRSGEAINLGHWLQCYAFDVIGHVTVGKRFGFLDSGFDVGGVMAAIEVYLKYLTHVGIYPFLHPILHALLRSIAPEDTGLGYIAKFAQRQIDDRLSNTSPLEKDRSPNNGKDFLTKFLALHAEDPSKLTMYDVKMACRTNIGAGSDTTGISLSAVLYYLCRNPGTLETLRNEIDTMAAEGKISNPVTFQEAQAMPYLQAVLKEALRMHPATGFPLERVVPKGGAMISGHFFPEGTTVGINSWVAHSNVDIFGPDAHIFRPERWLVSSKEASSNRLDSYFLAFGLGSRTCIGKNVSLMEMSKVIPQIVRHFEFEIVGNVENKLDTAGAGAGGGGSDGDGSDGYGGASGVRGRAAGEWKTSNRWFVKPQGFRARMSVRRK